MLVKFTFSMESSNLRLSIVNETILNDENYIANLVAWDVSNLM